MGYGTPIRRRIVAATTVVLAGVVLALLFGGCGGDDKPGKVPSAGTPAPAGPGSPSAFKPLPKFAANSVWTSRVDGSGEALDGASGRLVGRLNAMVDEEVRKGFGPWINTTDYSSPVYTVRAGQPLVPVTLDRPQPYAAKLKKLLARGVPIPRKARPAAGNDKHMIVWQPSSDTMWEFWHTQRSRADWHVEWGGVMTHVSRNPGHFTGEDAGWGATATSLPLVGGMMTPAELKAGVVDHALALAIPEARARFWTAPAQRTDGQVNGGDSIPEGARFRLDPTLDLDKLGLPRLTLIVARAAQRYGIILRDKAGVVTFYGQDPTPTGANPYPRLFGDRLPSKPLAKFPWKRLQLLKMQLQTFNHP